MRSVYRPVTVLCFLLASVLPASMFAQGFVHFPPLPASAAYQTIELPDGTYRVFGNHRNYNFNAQATLSNYRLSPQGIYLGIGDSLRNNHVSDYWLWLPYSASLLTFRSQLPSSQSIEIERFTTDSVTIYKERFNFPGADSIYFGNLLELKNNDLFTFGLIDTSSNGYSPYLACLRLNPTGGLLWANTLPLFPGVNFSADAFQTEIKELPNGDIVVVLMAYNKPVFFRLTASGDVVYQRTYQTLQLSGNPAASISDDGSMFVTFNDGLSGALYLISLNTAAEIIWQKDLRAAFNAEVDVPGTYQVIVNAAGNVTFAGTMLVDGIDRQLLIAEFAQNNGNLVGIQSFSGLASSAVRLLGSTLLSNGDLLFCGTWEQKAIVIKTDAKGRIFDGGLQGRISIDIDNDCVSEANEPPVRNWLIEAKSATKKHYAYSKPDGSYSFSNLDSAQYVIKVKQQNYTWQSCPDSLVVTVAHDTVTRDIAVKSVYDCPVMQLDIAAPFIRYCAPNTFHINYRNYGSDTARQVRAEITLDPAFIFAGASITPSAIQGNNLTFSLPDVLPSDGGSFSITTLMDCASTGPGRSACVRGRMYPDSLCISNLSNWSGGMLEATPLCDQDTVRFKLENKGKNPTGTLDYIIIEDHIFLRTEPINLNPGEVRFVSQYADAGGTIRLTSEQVPGHPVATTPSVAVEGCSNAATISTGYLTELPNQTGSPFTDIFCDKIIASFDPNDKRAFPEGYEPQHYIEQNTSIEYIIRFQNTGTDTAFRVVIVDTLSAHLDFSTVQPGSSSHRYVFTPSANGTLIFTFDPIALPDSNTNEPASHGYVQFRVQQMPNVPKGTRIENTAHIYFDVNSPVLTNKTFHTVGDIILSENNPDLPSLQLRLQPNPAKGHCQITYTGLTNKNTRLWVVDLLGNLIHEQAFNGETTLITNTYAPGLYFVQLREKQTLLNESKLVILD